MRSGRTIFHRLWHSVDFVPDDFSSTYPAMFFKFKRQQPRTAEQLFIDILIINFEPECSVRAKNAMHLAKNFSETTRPLFDRVF